MQSRRVIQIVSKAGLILNVFDGDAITVEIQRKGEYDSNALDSLRDILAKIRPQTSLDVGANIGNHALIISQHSETLIAFEPVHFIFDVLKSNVSLNQKKNVEVINLGLSNEGLSRNISIPENGNLGSSSLNAVGNQGDNLQIETVVGDEYLEQHFPGNRIDFIKIDVEGHEAEALIGLGKTIAKDQPLLLIEWNNQKTISSFTQCNLFNGLFSGYKAFSLTSTDNKKIHQKSIAGFINRLFAKLAGKKWCLSSFEPTMHYSNVYLVPKRFQAAFEQMRYCSR